MCGICGLITQNRISIEELNRMNNAMIRRGPDDSGVTIESSAYFNIGLGHRRLSIQDLSHNGHQPMYSSDKNEVIVFNGEIYNFKELKEELTEYNFTSSCDTEVILASYRRWGDDFIYRINGMFAIAIYDRKKEKIFLYRDRIGKKPLYYYVNGGTVIFGSELKPMMECSLFDDGINHTVLARYLYHGYINAPYTIFKKTQKILPGEMVEIALGGKNLGINKKQYYDISRVYESLRNCPILNRDEAINQTEEVIIDAVEKRMVADVPVGVFLSGGIDSSIVAAVAQSRNENRIKTFSIGFSENELDEAIHAKRIAGYLGTEHHELYISEDAMLVLVEELSSCYDEPFADSSQIPSMLVSKLAREYVTVALSGDGGDEFFCGYHIYEVIEKAQKFEHVANMMHRISSGSSLGQSLLKSMPPQVQLLVKNSTKSDKVQISDVELVNLANLLPNNSSDLMACKYPLDFDYKDWRNTRMMLDMKTYLPGDILCKMDRASMWYSLECRSPLLDQNVIEKSFRIPVKMLVTNGTYKYILREIAYKYVPKEIINRPKQGFGVPRRKWLKGPLKEMLEDYSQVDYLKKQQIFNAKEVNRFVNEYVNGTYSRREEEVYAGLVWAYLIFQKWEEKIGSVL